MLTIKIRPRTVDQTTYQALIAQGVSPLIARILAARPTTKNPEKLYQPSLKMLDHPQQLAAIDTAVARLIQAIQHGEVIGIETDHDCDGQTSHAVIFTTLTQCFQYPKSKTLSFIGHRLEEGYGLSDALAKRILDHEPRPTLVITADNGSTDEPRIAELKAAGIDTIVTDHHQIPETGIPTSAIAVLNPTRTDCQFPDPYIAGCMVAWLFMAATRRALIETGQLPETCMPMQDVLDFVAVGTVADCVSMARSLNNRAVVQYGLKRIQNSQRPCWQAIRPLIKNPRISSDDLGFTIGPLLNSDGRLSDALGSVSFLLADDVAQATTWVQTLWQQNQARKQIQKSLVAQAMQTAEQLVNAGHYSLVIQLPDGHAGVHGIAASRIKDHFGRPTILFSQKQNHPELLTGSARSIDDLDIRQCMADAVERLQDERIHFGGHRGAAGITLPTSCFTDFQQAFETAARNSLKPDMIGPALWTDGPLTPDLLNLKTVDELIQLEPFGREFDRPTFELNATLTAVKTIGQDANHAKLTLNIAGHAYPAIWFNCCSEDNPLTYTVGDAVSCVVSLQDNHYYTRELQLQILHLESC